MSKEANELTDEQKARAQEIADEMLAEAGLGGHDPGCPAVADDESDFEHLADAGECACGAEKTPDLEPTEEAPPHRLIGPKVERILLERVKLGVRAIVGLEALDAMCLELRDREDMLAKHLVASLETYLIGGRRHKTEIGFVEYPKDWWQAFRARWCPRWWLRRHPVKKDRHVLHVSYQHVCPHLNYAWPKNAWGQCPEMTHLEFLKQDTPHEGEYW